MADAIPSVILSYPDGQGGVVTAQTHPSAPLPAPPGVPTGPVPAPAKPQPTGSPWAWWVAGGLLLTGLGVMLYASRRPALK